MADTETRIVEMRFDSRDFDPKIAKSKKSLEDFKKELNFEETSKGLKEFTSNINRIDFSGLASNIERLTDKFTGLGDAGEWVMSRIRSGIEGAMIQTEQFIKSFTTAQIDVGQSKYDALNKAVQALIATGEYTEDQAYSVFERVMEYTDQTSANFQVMVDQIASFVATGQGLQSSEKAMEGIFNMTAKAGKGATEASAAMGVFSKAMGQGYLSLQNWQSLNQTAHIVTADFRKQILDAAVATGDLVKQNDKYYINSKKYGKEETKTSKKKKKTKEEEAAAEAAALKKMEVTADNLENTLNKKWMSKDTMMAVFDKYYFAKLTGATEEELESFAGVAYKSAQRALTFADAMNAVKESISSGWMTSFRHIFGDVTDAMEVFTNLCERVIESIYGLQEARNKLLKIWSLTGGRQALIDTVLGDYGKSVETGAYGLLDLFDDVGSIISEGFWNMLRLFAKGYEDKLWDKKGFKEAWLGLKLRDITKGIKDFVASVKNFFTENVKIGDKTTTRLEMIHNIVKGIGAALVLAGNIVMGVMHFVGGLKEQLNPTILTIQDFFSQLGTILYGTAKETNRTKSINQFFDDMLESLKPLTSTINDVTAKLSSLLIEFIKWGVESGFFAKVFDKLKNLFIGFNGILNRTIKPLVEFLGDLFVIFKELFEGGFDPKQVEQVGGKVQKAMGKMFASMLGVESLEKAGEQLKEKFKGLMNDLLVDAPDWVKDVIAAIKDLFGLWDTEDQGNKDSIFTKIREFFQNGFSSVGDFLKQLFGSFEGFNFYDLVKTGFGFASLFNLLNTVAGWFKGTNLYTVLMMFLGAATLWEIWRLVRNIKNIGKSIYQVADELSSSLAHGFKVRWDDYGEYIMQLAKGIGIFVACVAVLGSMKTGNLVQGLVALGLIMGAVYLFDKLLKKSFDNDSIKDQLGFAAKLIALGLAITSITAAVAILALALVPLGKLSMGGWIKSMAGLVIILGSIMAFAWGIKKLDLTTVHLAGLITLAAAVGILVLSVLPFALMNWEQFARSLAGMASVLAILTLFASGLKALKLSSAELTGIIALAAGVAILVIGVVPFALMSWEAFARSLAGIASVLTVLTVFAWGLKKLDLKSAQLKGLIALSAGIAIMVVSIVPFALMTWAAFARSLAGLVATLGALTLFAWGLKKLNITNTKLKGLIVLAAGIAIIVLSIVPFALMNWESWTKSVVGLVAILAALTLFALGLSRLQLSTTKLTGLLALASSIGIITFTLDPLAKMDWEGWKRAVLGLVAILGMLFLFSLGVAKLNLGTTKMVGLLGLAYAIQILIKALDPIAKMDWEGWKKAMAGLLVILGMMYAFMLGMSVAKISASVGALVAMLGLALVIVAISFALNEIRNIDTGLIQAFTTGLTAMVVAMAAAIFVLSAVPIGGGLTAILLIAAGIIAVAAILAIAIPLLLGAVGNSLAEFSAKLELIAGILQTFSSKINEVDESGIDKAKGIFNKLKTMMEELESAQSLSSNVSTFTTALYDLGTGLYIFDYYVKDIPDPESSTAFKMVDKILNLGSSLSTFSIGNFAQEIYGLGVGLYAFDYIGSLTSGSEDSKPLQLLTELAGCANDLQTLSTIGLDTLKGQLAGLGGAMMLYAQGAQEITGVEGDQTSNVESAMSILQAITQTFADKGGFTLPTIPGKEELGTFGADLAALAGAIVQFANASNGLGENTDKALLLLGFMADLKERLTEDNLKSVKAFKDNNVSGDVMTQFSTDIIALGGALSSFIDLTKDIDEGKVKTATDALGFFATLQEKLVAQEAVLSVIKWFTGEDVNKSVLEKFGKNIEQLGLSLKGFAESVQLDENSTASFEKAIEALGFFSALQEKLPTVGGIVSWVTGTQQTLTDLAAEIVLLGEAIAAFNSSVTDENGKSKLNDEAMSSALTILNSVVSLLSRLQTEMEPVGGFLSFFTGQQYNAGNLKTDMESFSGVVAELLKISNMFNNGDEKNPVPNETDINNAIHILDVIIDFISKLKDKMPVSRPLLEAFTGEAYNVTKLASDITNFSTVIAELVKTGKILNGEEEGSVKIDEGSFNSAIASIDLILGFITQLGEKMPADNTFLDSIFTGEKYSTDNLKTDIANFTAVIDELVKIGTLLNNKDTTHPLPKKEDIDKAVTAIDPITDFVKDLGEKMPASSWLDVFKGRTYDLTNLQTDITNFGLVCDELKVVADKLSGKGKDAITIKEDAMTAASTSVSAILEFATTLGTDMGQVGGFVQSITSWFSGHTFNLADLQKELGNFGDVCTELVGINKTLTGEDGNSPIADTTTFGSATDVIDQIVAFSQSLAEKAPKVGGIQSFFTNLWGGGNYTFEDLKRDLTNLGQGLGAFSTGVGDNFNSEAALAAIQTAVNISEVLRNLSVVASENQGYIDFEQNLMSLNAFMKVMSKGDYYVAEEIPPMIESIAGLAKSVSEAIDLAGGIKPENINIFNQMAEAIQRLSKTDPSFDFKPAGVNIATGIANGINEAQGRVYEAVRALAQNTYTTLLNAIDSNSPSKLFAQAGDFMAAGIAVGIDDGSMGVQKAMTDLASDTFDTTTSVLAIISQLLSEELDANPTITPVLDLTDLSNGITLMNGMLDGNRMSIDASTAANIAANNLPQNYTVDTNQNGTDLSGIYERMTQLGDRITEMGNKITKMQIVLNTGVIAGAVTDQVDLNIGSKAFYAGRGN